MGKPTGFMDYNREDAEAFSVKERIQNYNEFHTPLNKKDQEKQGARCMECGVPFCQAGMQIGNAFSGCPLNTLSLNGMTLFSKVVGNRHITD